VFFLKSIFEDKSFLLVVCAWFVFSFFVLWFIGGACLNPVKGTDCIASGKLDFLKSVPIVGLLFPFGQWNSLMYFLAPICGFIFAFVLIRWWNNYFDTTEAAGIGFLVLILLALFIGYYINLSFYLGEAASLNSRNNVKYSLQFCLSESSQDECYAVVQKTNNELYSQASSNNQQIIQQFIPVAFWAELRQSVYFVFVLGAIAAWIPLFVGQLYDKYKASGSTES
jgi:hypothetical protein